MVAKPENDFAWSLSFMPVYSLIKMMQNMLVKIIALSDIQFWAFFMTRVPGFKVT